MEEATYSWGPTTASATEETETPQKEQADQPAGAGGPLALDGPAGAGAWWRRKTLVSTRRTGYSD
jgi:hypothetical protein